MGPTYEACKSTFHGKARHCAACHALLDAVLDHQIAYHILQNQPRHSDFSL